jgi:tetratricopeptide (TPR) repeat protein
LWPLTGGIVGELGFGFGVALLTGLLLGLLGGWVSQSILKRDRGLVAGLFLGLFFGLLAGPLGGLLFGLVWECFERTETETRRRPNESIRRAAVNGAVFLGLGGLGGLIFGLVLWRLDGCLWGFCNPAYFRLGGDVWGGLLAGVPTGVAISLGVALIYGLDAVNQHYSLRWLLARAGRLPYPFRDGRLVAYLDGMAERILLRRVGGGWIFVHRYLLEHCASLSANIEEHPQDIIEQGVAHIENGNYTGALAQFDRAIGLDAKDSWFAFANRGRAHLAVGSYPAALSDFNRAIALNQQYPWPIQVFANRFLGMGRQYAWAIAHRGETYRQMGNYEAALADFDRAIALDENYAWAIASRGVAYWLMGNYEAALADFDRAIQLDEKLIWPIGSRGITYRLMGDYQAATTELGRGIELDGDEFGWWYYQRALAHLAQSQANAAESDLSLAIGLADKKYQEDPKEWDRIFSLALFVLAAGQTAVAERLYHEGANAPPCSIKDAIDDLEDLLTVLPGHEQATAIRDYLLSRVQAV